MRTHQLLKNHKDLKSIVYNAPGYCHFDEFYVEFGVHNGEMLIEAAKSNEYLNVFGVGEDLSQDQQKTIYETTRDIKNISFFNIGYQNFIDTRMKHVPGRLGAVFFNYQCKDGKLLKSLFDSKKLSDNTLLIFKNKDIQDVGQIRISAIGKLFPIADLYEDCALYVYLEN